MTPICGIKRGETLIRYQFGRKILVIYTVMNTLESLTTPENMYRYFNTEKCYT